MEQPPPLPHQPLTFQERGITIPATTPLLLGTRVRRGQLGLEFIIPNPAGGRGVYVLSWAAVKDLWHPTIHDRLLHDELSSAPEITPSAVRLAGRAVAARGAAGQEAADGAARAAAVAEAAEAMTLRHIAGRIDRHAAAGAAPLISALACIGVGPRAAEARIPLLLAQMAALRDEVQAWADAHGDETAAVPVLRAASDQAIAAGSKVLTDARAHLQDLQALLQRWAQSRAEPGFVVNRPDWMLDGWELPCLLWQSASSIAEQRTAIQDICHLLPVLPREAASWAGMSLSGPGETAGRRTVTLNKDWRTGLSTLGATARNERLRAWAA